MGASLSGVEKSDVLYIAPCSEPSERTPMEKRTSDYNVIVGDENTTNGQLAGDETVWKPIMMNTMLDPTKARTMLSC
jgi:hypothetical protein